MRKSIKWLALILATMMVICLSGCSEKDTYLEKFQAYCDANSEYPFPDPQITFTMKDVFSDIDFDRVYVSGFKDAYSGKEAFCSKLGLKSDVDFEKMQSDYERRLLFVKENTIVYVYEVNHNELEFEEYGSLLGGSWVEPDTPLVATYKYYYGPYVYVRNAEGLFEKECVPDEETAIRITGDILAGYQRQGYFDDYVFLSATYQDYDSVWVVTYTENTEAPGACVSFAIRKDSAMVERVWIGE